MQVLRTLPADSAVAVSGGVDSLVTLHWISQRRPVRAVHYIHDSEYAAQEYEFVQKFCKEISVELTVQTQLPSSRSGQSQEEYWRQGRYSFFKQLPFAVCTGHTLDDAVEWYLFTSFSGQGHYMDYQHANVIRPFLTTKKMNLLAYADKYALKWLEDPSNRQVDFAVRNRIRHDILPQVLRVNPGLYNMVKRRIVERTNNTERPLCCT
jgi:tRNA(Ile)-lysidine synthase